MIKIRLYTICNVVEDEVHFLCQCHKYENQRKTLYDSLKDSNILLSLDSSRTFFELMTNDNKIVMKAVGKFIKECSVTWVLKRYLILHSKLLVVYSVTDADSRVREYCVCMCVSVWKEVGFVHNMFVVICHWFAYNPNDGYICARKYILFYSPHYKSDAYRCWFLQHVSA